MSILNKYIGNIAYEYVLQNVVNIFGERPLNRDISTDIPEVALMIRLCIKWVDLVLIISFIIGALIVMIEVIGVILAIIGLIVVIFIVIVAAYYQ